jgi:hypothetical protein
MEEIQENKKSGKVAVGKALQDPAFVSLLAINLVMVYLYDTNIAQASNIVFIYYLQSVLIGITHVVKIAAGKKEPGLTHKSKWRSALFFALHYVFFHFVYLIFLVPMLMHIPGRVNILMVGSTVFAFLLGSVFETTQFLNTRNKKPIPQALLFFGPYLRIIPMHIFIILAFTQFEPKKFLYFLLLKTVTDVAGYWLLKINWQPTLIKSLQNNA